MKPCNQCIYEWTKSDAECRACYAESTDDAEYPRFKPSLSAQVAARDLAAIDSNRENER